MTPFSCVFSALMHDFNLHNECFSSAHCQSITAEMERTKTNQSTVAQKQAFKMLRTDAPYLDSGCKALQCCRKCRCAVKRRIPPVRTARLSDARLILVPVLPNIANSGCSFSSTLCSIFVLGRVREMSWVGGCVAKERIERIERALRAWRVTQIKAERGAGEEGRESQADERVRDQGRDKRYEMDVAEGARREEEK